MGCFFQWEKALFEMKASLQKPLGGSWNPTCLGATERKTKWTFFLCSKAFLCRCVFLLINKSGQRGQKHTHRHSHSATVCFQPRETAVKNKNIYVHFPSTETNDLKMPTVFQMPTAGTEAIHSMCMTPLPSFETHKGLSAISNDNQRQGRIWDGMATLPRKAWRGPLV